MIVSLTRRAIAALGAREAAFRVARPGGTFSQLVDRMVLLAHIWLPSRKVQEAVARARRGPVDVEITVELDDEVVRRLTEFSALTSPGASASEVLEALAGLVDVTEHTAS